MASPSIAAFFNVRKRAAADDLSHNRLKLARLDDPTSSSIDQKTLLKEKLGGGEDGCSINQPTIFAAPSKSGKSKNVEKKTSRRTVKRHADTSNNGKTTQPKIVKFTLAGTLSPKKLPNTEVKCAFQHKQTNSHENSPAVTKSANASALQANSSSIGINNSIGALLSSPKKDLTFGEIKTKVNRSARLQELKDILQKRQQLEDQLQGCVQKRSGKLRPDASSTVTSGAISAVTQEGQTLKKFDTIELEVLSSPQKGLRTPTKNERSSIMSPKKEATPKRLFSPTKSPIPAYQRFQTLAEATQSTLQLPYKYRCMAEVFRCVESICSMFYNRKETITFKKLKPAVQRMLRKNFTEKHLAQIKYLYPDAYNFEQRKMLNPGSHTKYDYYQLIISPNVQPNVQKQTSLLYDEDNIVKNADNSLMNPHIIIGRQQKFHKILLERVKEEHDKFLKTLDVAINIPKEKIRRWHQEFDLESCPEILAANLPQPPNIEKFSSAKEILSTARNLFNCATPMERAINRYETAKADVTEGQQEEQINDAVNDATEPTPAPIAEDPLAKALKGVPKSLLEKIRAKQAAKAYEAMTRRPSQDLEASKYSRLPELARHIRNIFITENKGVLELDKVLTKLENSYREKLTREIFKELLELMAKEAPKGWLSFHYIRKMDYVKINRNVNLNDLVKELEEKAQEKAK